MSTLASATEYIQLSTFDWFIVLITCGVLIGLLGFLLKYLISNFKLDMENKLKAECDSRINGDNDIVHGMKEISDTLSLLTQNNLKEHATFVSREETDRIRKESLDAVSVLNKRIDDMYNNYFKPIIKD